MSALGPPADLTLPREGSTTLRSLWSRALGRLVREAAALRPHDALEAHALEVLVRRPLREEPGRLVAALRRPTVGTLLRCLRPPAGPAHRAERQAAFLAELALESAALGVLSEPVTLARAPRELVSLVARGRVEAPPDTVTTRIAPDGVRFERSSGGPVRVALSAMEPAHHTIVGEVVLATVDNNPLSMVELHPDKDGNAVSLGARSSAEWVRALAEALSLVRTFLPELWPEVELLLSQLVPVGYHDERHLSASYREAVGTVYLTLHPSAATLAEAVVHEVSHHKLNVLAELDPMLTNAFTSLHVSPVRPDPRPLHGVLLAVHAFLPVARLYERMLSAGHALATPALRARYDDVRRKNHEAAEVVCAAGAPTLVGEGLVAEIARLAKDPTLAQRGDLRSGEAWV